MQKNVGYVVIPELHIAKQLLCENWQIGQSMPMIESEEKIRCMCDYNWDYDRWIPSEYL